MASYQPPTDWSETEIVLQEYSPPRDWSETEIVLERRQNILERRATETLQVSPTATKTVRANRFETPTVSDNRSLSTEKPVSEQVSIQDSIQKLQAIRQSVSLSIADSDIFSLGKTVTQGLDSQDSLNRKQQAARQVQQQFNVSDFRKLELQSNLNQSLSILSEVDSASELFRRVFVSLKVNDDILAELVALIQEVSLQETARVTDKTSFSLLSLLDEQNSITDSQRFEASLSRNISVFAEISDSDIKQLNRQLQQNAELSDKINKQFKGFKELQEIVNTLDEETFKLLIKFVQTTALLDLTQQRTLKSLQQEINTNIQLNRKTLKEIFEQLTADDQVNRRAQQERKLDEPVKIEDRLQRKASLFRENLEQASAEDNTQKDILKIFDEDTALNENLIKKTSKFLEEDTVTEDNVDDVADLLRQIQAQFNLSDSDIAQLSRELTENTVNRADLDKSAAKEFAEELVIEDNQAKVLLKLLTVVTALESQEKKTVLQRFAESLNSQVDIRRVVSKLFEESFESRDVLSTLKKLSISLNEQVSVADFILREALVLRQVNENINPVDFGLPTGGTAVGTRRIEENIRIVENIAELLSSSLLELNTRLRFNKPVLVQEYNTVASDSSENKTKLVQHRNQFKGRKRKFNTVEEL